MNKRYKNLSPEEYEELCRKRSEVFKKLWAERYEEMRAKSGPKKGYVWSDEVLQKFKDRSKKWTPEDWKQRKEWSKLGGRVAAERRAQNPNWGKEHSEKIKAYYARKKENEIWMSLLEPLLN